MKRIGVRELRQHASVWLRQVEDGESFEITDRGRPVAHLIPVHPGNELERLRVAGLLSESEGSIFDLEPLPPKDGVPPPSEILARLRAHER